MAGSITRSVLAAALGVLSACEAGDELIQEPPSVAAPVVFIDEARCADCHAGEHAAWSGSHHDLAMQPATGENVLGDFGEVVFEAAGIRARFFRKGERFFVRTAGADGAEADFPVAYVFGVEPLQQLLLPFPDGRFQAFSVAWDTRPRAQGGQRWFALYPDEPPSPGDALHWSGSYLRWNQQCAECHSTDLRKNFDPDGGRYATQWARLDVGCQACHGPGSAHQTWAEGGKPEGDDGLVVPLPQQAEACARCHARRHRVSDEDERGRPLLDDFVPETLREGLYHPDGQILEEVYVYGSFLQSRMYAMGVDCGDCHDPHTARLRAEGDALCVRCHSESPEARFPTLAAKRYDTPEHHQHPQASAGARCVACHMPAKTYMQIDPRRDHSLRVPRPDLSATLGTPNACNGCHADRDPAWAAAEVETWFPGSTRRGPHFGALFSAAWAGQASAADLAALALDSEAPAIVRATAIELAPRFGREGLDAVVRAAADPEPLVRSYAARGLVFLPPADRLVAGVPLLEDPLRAVRVEAALALAELPRETLPAAARGPLRAALGEYVAAQQALRDTPGANLNLALLAEREGESLRAEDFYRAGIALDTGFFQAHANLAQLQARSGRADAAERTLREGLAVAPQAGELHYALGLVLAETSRLEDSAESLGRAAALLPGDARAAYNHGLALQQLGRAAPAQKALTRARELDPGDPDIAHALGVFHLQQGHPELARPHAEQAFRQRGDPASRRLLEAIEAR